MKKFLLIIVLLVSTAIVIPFMQISVMNKIIAEVVVIGSLYVIYDTVQKEKNDGKKE